MSNKVGGLGVVRTSGSNVQFVSPLSRVISPQLPIDKAIFIGVVYNSM